MYIMMGTIGASLGSAYSFLMRIDTGELWKHIRAMFNEYTTVITTRLNFIVD